MRRNERFTKAFRDRFIGNDASISSQPDCHTRRMRSDDTTTDNYYSRQRDTGDASDEKPSTARMTL